MLTVFAAPAADPDPSPITSGAYGESQPSWFDDFPSHGSHSGPVSPSDSESSDAWTEETIVRLHFMLLDDIAKLADRATPIAEKFEILRWIYTDPEPRSALLRASGCSVDRSTRPSGRSILMMCVPSSPSRSGAGCSTA